MPRGLFKCRRFRRKPRVMGPGDYIGWKDVNVTSLFRSGNEVAAAVSAAPSWHRVTFTKDVFLLEVQAALFVWTGTAPVESASCFYRLGVPGDGSGPNTFADPTSPPALPVAVAKHGIRSRTSIFRTVNASTLIALIKDVIVRFPAGGGAGNTNWSLGFDIFYTVIN